MFNNKVELEKFIDEVRPQFMEILKKTEQFGITDNVLVWLSRGLVEFSASCSNGEGYKEALSIKDGKIYAEVTISKKAEVLENGGDVG